MTLVIINPASGIGHGSPEARGRQRLGVARAALDALGEPYRVELTTSAGHGAALARAAVAEGTPLVCVWGGDGTMNEVASVLAFSAVPLGVVPGGSGNGFARGLGISLNPSRAIAQAVRGAERVIDAGEIGGRLFFNVAGLGFDAHVARRFNESGERRGFLKYIKTSLVELFKYQAVPYKIALDGETLQRYALMVVVANGDQYGNGARVAPQARPDDGRLDLVVVAPGSPLGNVWNARRLFDGSLTKLPGVVMREIETLRISGGNGWAANGSAPNGSSTDGSSTNGLSPRGLPGNDAAVEEALWFHVDGEPVRGAASLDVRIHPRALRVRVPSGRA